MPFDPGKHHRDSLRLPGFDYSSTGAYFVTICTLGRECLFGDIEDGEMVLNRFGRIIVEEWRKTSEVRPNVMLDEFVVMPNHIHGILWITRRAHAPTTTTGPVSGSLGAIIGGVKSAMSKRINEIRGSSGRSLWQRNFYDHVVRNDHDLMRIRQYIAENPLKWELDENNPARLRQP